MSETTPLATEDLPLGTYRAPAKLILFGEHFVVHGGPALALPLPLFGTQIDVRDDPGAARITLETDSPIIASRAALAHQVTSTAKPWKARCAPAYLHGEAMEGSRVA